MATISAGMVKELRESTGAGMMDCKAALTETDGDMTAAQDWLRKKGLSKAAKKAGRIAAEGLIGSITSGTKGVVVEVNSETDFVARNEQFQGMVKMVAQVALKTGADVEAIKAAKVGDVTVERAISDAIATIGENMSLRRAASARSQQGRGVELRSRRGHRRRRQDGRAGRARIDRARTDELAALGRQLAMHVAATNPQALDPSRPRSGDREARKGTCWPTSIASRASLTTMIEKIVESGLKTYYKEVCLLEQAFIHDTGKSVAQAVKEAEGKVGGPVKITGFVRYALGEGIEKQETDFAAEVAAASGKK